MSSMEERIQVLQMIETGKINAQEGARLLEALDTADGPEPVKSSSGQAKWFRVRVTDKLSGKTKVNVNIPIDLARVGINMGARFVPEMGGVDMDEILSAIKHGAQGKLIEVDDEEDNEHVEIYVE